MRDDFELSYFFFLFFKTIVWLDRQAQFSCHSWDELLVDCTHAAAAAAASAACGQATADSGGQAITTTTTEPIFGENKTTTTSE